MSETVSLTIATDAGELETITSVVEALGQREGWSPELVFRANLVLEELGLNIINYGHDGPESRIEITLDSRPDRLTIEISNDGLPFDPINDAPAPDLTSSVEERPIGGLGLYLVRTLMDEMMYLREGGKNHLALVARRDP